MENSTKYTLLRTIGRFFYLIFGTFKSWPLTLFYGAVIIGISLAFYTARYCGADNLNCNVAVTVGVFLLIALCSICYLYDLYCITFKNSVFKISYVLKFDTAKIKSVGFIIGYIMSYVVSGYISWKILQKPADPNWRAEFVYFVVFFVFCLVPIAAMRFSVAVAYYFNKQKLPSLKQLYKVTEGRSYISIVGFLFVMLILSVLNLYLSSVVNRVLVSSSAMIIVFKIYLLVLIFLFEFSFLLCFFEAQRQLIEENAPTEDVEEEKQEAPAIKSAVKKAAVKKKTKAEKKQK